jgi:arabinofuranosyltransferase
VKRSIVAAGALVFLLLLVRTAWVSDDAYITFRTVDNALNGYGLRWNVADRVQSYTHPLWMFVMTAVTGVTGDVYFTSIAVSIALSLAAVLLIAWRIAPTAPMALLALSALALSKAFVDYSTSGLENALTHFLLVLFVLTRISIEGWTASTSRDLFKLSLLAALIMLNRLDTGLLVLPSLAWIVWRSVPGANRLRGLLAPRTWLPVVLGLLPLVAWEVFSIIYYGFPFPNTAYSKIKTGIPEPELLQQGFLYLLDSLHNDPLTLAVIAAAVVSPFVARVDWTIPAGIALYVVYVVWVGGDFMSGRFLAAPFLCAVMHLAQQEVREFSAVWGAAMVLVWMAGLAASPQPTLATSASYGADIERADAIAPTGITDERRYYYPQSGLLNARRGVPMPNHKWIDMGHELAANGSRFFSTDAAGFIGYAAGPGVHFIDKYGLGDALLSRLPAEVPWRIGHFRRRVPDGYEETVQARRNVIRDPGVAAYYDRLSLITEGPIWSRERWRTIVGMNTGRYERLIDSYGRASVSLDTVGQPGDLPLTLRGVDVVMPQPVRAGKIEMSVSRNDAYRVLFMNDGSVVAERSLDQPMTRDGGLRTHVIDGPGDREFDVIRILPSGGDSVYRLGHVRLLSASQR